MQEQRMSVSAHHDHAETLTALAAVADELGSGDLARDARDLASRVADGRFFLATVGQFKRGKSTLLNALIGELLLPTGVAPVTAAITVLRYGARLAADVVFKDGRRTSIPISDVHTFVTEADNHENMRHVAAVEIFSPSSLLASGMCLVDTPGLGSVFQANTEETRAFVPHIDAALVVLGVDPPISADELALVSDVAQQIGQLVFVLNKVDRLNASDLAEARRFTADTLTRQLNRPDERLFEVSATERLTIGPTRDWTGLENRLRELASSTSVVVDQSARRGVARIAARLLHDVDEQRGALTRPLDESHRRIADLEKSTRRAEQLLRDLAALFRSEEQRIFSGFFDTTHNTFVTSSVPAVEADVRRAVEGLASTHRAGALRQPAYSAAQGIVAHRIRMWLKEIEPQTEALYRQAAQRFVTLANDFLHFLAASGDASFERIPRSLDPEAGFRAPRHFVFTDLMHLTGVGPIDWLLDRFRGQSSAVHVVSTDANRYAERLLTSNSSRVIFDLRERLTESRAAFESELRVMLAEISASAACALDRARELRKSGDHAVTRQLRRLDECRTTLRDIADQRGAGADDVQR
jgi:hypothetical protein